MTGSDRLRGVRLSGKNRQAIARICASTGGTADEILGEEYDAVTPEYARGYMEGFVQQASDESVLFAYFLTKLLIRK